MAWKKRTRGEQMERTLIIVKPDGVQRGLIGAIITRFERRGLRLAAMKLMQISPDLAARHYAEHKKKKFYESLLEFITSGPAVVAVIEGKGAIEIARETIGATNPAEATPGTIRADFGLETGRNLVHGSDGPESAEREISLFFVENEILSYARAVDDWICE
jgi:nucleoside-diphosphate kinase